MSAADEVAGARRRGALTSLGLVAALFAALALTELALMAPWRDLLSARVWSTVLLTHGLVALALWAAALAVTALAALLARVGISAAGRVESKDACLGLALFVVGFGHGWPILRGPLEAAVGRVLALALVALFSLLLYWLIRRCSTRPTQRVLLAVAFGAAALGYYLVRAEPLGLPSQPRLAALAGLLLFVASVVLAARARRGSALWLLGALGMLILVVRGSAPAPHSAIVAGPPVEATVLEAPAPGVRHPMLLIVIDTLRVDALDLEGGPDGRTPHLAKMAAGADTFKKAIANASWTLPAHASLFTGSRVSRHRLDMTSSRGFSPRLGDTLPTLHERFAARGYATTCISSNGIVGPASQLTRGCGVYRHPGRAWTLQTLPLRLWYALSPSTRPALEDQLLTLLTGLRRHATADEVLALALTELAAETPPPYLFLNLMDVHKPYPPAAASEGPSQRAFLWSVLGVLSGFQNPETFDRQQAPWFRLAYLDQVRQVDAALGAFFETLRQNGLYDDALIVVTSDHGEAFFENPELPLYNDHHGTYEPAVRIPLIVKRPNQTVGRVFDHLVEQADLASATLELAAGVGDAATLFTRGDDRPAISEWNPHPTPGAMSTLPVRRVALYRDDEKLVLEDSLRAPQLFDLRESPFEGVEISSRRPQRAERLRAELLEVLAREWAAGEGRTPQLEEPPPELLETLRALGYIE